MDFYKFSFVTPLEKHSMGVNSRGELFYNVLFLPDELRGELPLDQYPRLRVDGEMNEMPFEAALQPAKGRWYLLLSQRFMREHNLQLGDSVEVRFNIGDQDYVHMPSELLAALNDNDAANERWQSFTPGKQRGYAAMVSSAKQTKTRQSRALKMIGYILDGKNPGGR